MDSVGKTGRLAACLAVLALLTASVSAETAAPTTTTTVAAPITTAAAVVGSTAAPAISGGGTTAEKTAEPLTEKHYTVRTEDGKTVMTADTATPAFWEMPQLDAGESVSGTLFLENKSKGLVTVKLDAIRIPTEARSYLSELHISVMHDDKLLYSGTYTDISAADLSINLENASYGSGATYTVTVSRPFTVEKPVIPSQITWEFSCALTPVYSEQPCETKTIWLLWLLFSSAALMVVSVCWITVRRQRRLFAMGGDKSTKSRKHTLSKA